MDTVNEHKVDHTEEINLKVDKDSSTLTAAQRARAERNRQKARALREARLVQHPKNEGCQRVESRNASRALDSGGGFLLEEEPAPEATPCLRPAPVVHRLEQPHCLVCELPFPQSYLFDTFDYSVCDNCRDDEDAHSLITRTEAKSEYLLKDCDLDSRPPPLRCVRRRNPHRSRFAEMRLYLRAQVEARALQVWGSAEELQRELEERRARRDKAADTAARRRLRALRMDVRSSLYDRTRAHHEHAFGPETYDAAADIYSRSCECGHVETYEKM
ncbi:DNA repair protein complementing XP-A cells homolog [Vanessa cardui]|uniref:DNA repair protein complementing XP-A cells homolog n=1 Tax=Vanessa cardui TaxID=171605 RepID=UPI001F13DAFB|nr:DNA repair protein complementing XP-A cells homolog [Vanessa cardui]XP_046978541.1 DNA repair protein complementing XP-A cells homolog [Vanessa cardui]XP_046978549.1 DNA repair protein complementing XP-A cells homolog [Vanessa cardui]XP_046978557.1 DNA repair protein complementing XP-A cells homolog [Vanessa cardui]